MGTESEPVREPRLHGLWVAAHGRCCYCRVFTVPRQLAGAMGAVPCGFNLFTMNGQTYPMATVEHIVPRGRGGGDGPENLACACYPCNQQRNREQNPGAPPLVAAHRRKMKKLKKQRGRHKRFGAWGVAKNPDDYHSHGGWYME